MDVNNFSEAELDLIDDAIGAYQGRMFAQIDRKNDRQIRRAIHFYHNKCDAGLGPEGHKIMWDVLEKLGEKVERPEERRARLAKEAKATKAEREDIIRTRKIEELQNQIEELENAPIIEKEKQDLHLRKEEEAIKKRLAEINALRKATKPQSIPEEKIETIEDIKEDFDYTTFDEDTDKSEEINEIPEEINEAPEGWEDNSPEPEIFECSKCGKIYADKSDFDRHNCIPSSEE